MPHAPPPRVRYNVGVFGYYRGYFPMAVITITVQDFTVARCRCNGCRARARGNKLDCTHNDLNQVLTMLGVEKFKSEKKK